jgi:hypothetical protein
MPLYRKGAGTVVRFGFMPGIALPILSGDVIVEGKQPRPKTVLQDQD